MTEYILAFTVFYGIKAVFAILLMAAAAHFVVAWRKM